MDQMKIANLEVGNYFEGLYILKTVEIKTDCNGNSYAAGVICDATACMDLKVFNYDGEITAADAGKIVKFDGHVDVYKGHLQAIADYEFYLADEEDMEGLEINELLPVAPIDIDARTREVEDLIATIEDEDYRRIAETMFMRHRDSFIRIPAAKSVHHSALSGLLMHTSNMLRQASMLAEIYANIIDRSLLLTGTLLHDFAKAEEFVFSELGIVTDYSTKGQLLGHLVMGAQEVAEVARELGIPENKSILLQHMLLSHHGEPEYGAAIRPKCAEAEMLHFIDMIDSRMEIYAEAFNEIKTGEFTKPVFALNRRIYKHKEDDNETKI